MGGGAYAQQDDLQFLIWAGAQQPLQPGEVHDPRFQTMYHLNPALPDQDSPAESAAHLISLLVQRRNGGLLSSDGDKANVAVLIQNFAGATPDDSIPCHFTETSLYCTSDFVSGIDLDPELPRLQPWCLSARPRMKAWTEQMLAEFFSQRAAMSDPVPVPSYWLLDSEAQLHIYWGTAAVQLLKNVHADGRWHSTPVPGFGQTMAQLYATERSVPDPDWNTSLAAELSFSDGVEDRPTYRDIFTWYSYVCTRARDAIFDETFYEPIRQAYASRSLAAPRMANYEDLEVDGQVDSFGWFDDRSPLPNTFVQDRSSFDVPERSYTRGHQDRHSQGHSQNFQYANQRWACLRGHASAGNSAPVMYPVGSRFFWCNDYYRLNHPLESIWRITLRRARHDIESVINSGSGTNANKVMPWLWGWGKYGELTYESIQFLDPEWLDCLLLCRAKGITTAQVWYPLLNQQTTEANWDPIRKLYSRVYKPQLSSYSVTVGSEETANNPGRLTRTLRQPQWLAIEDDYLDRVSVAPDQALLSLTQVEFSGIPHAETVTNVCAGSVRIDLEGVLPPDAILRVEILDRANNTWVGMLPTGVVLAPAWFSAYTPDGDFRETVIASLPTGGQFVSTGGLASVRIVAKHTTERPIKLDLVQFVAAYDGGDCSGGGGDGGGGSGTVTGGEGQSFAPLAQSDSDKDDAVSLDDAARFLELWLAGSLGADFNNDGVVNEADLADYAASFALEAGL